MSGKRQFLGGGKDPHLHALLPLHFRGPWKDERCLREICLSRQRLHLGIGQSTGVREDGKLVAFEWPAGENVQQSVGNSTLSVVPFGPGLVG
jgi:hypothetical protein